MKRPPPKPTLFPYPTLFRSQHRGGVRGAGRDRDEPHLGHRRDAGQGFAAKAHGLDGEEVGLGRSEEHTSELQSRSDLVCRLLLEKKKLPYTQLTSLCYTVLM